METPPIRILQRPCQIADKNSSEPLKPPTTVKSLEQREADYAAARRRIMGSDTPEQEECDESTSTNMTTKGTTVDVSDGYSVPRPEAVITNNLTTTATPLMSIQATPNPNVGFNPDFRFTVGTTSCFNAGNGQMRTVSQGARQASVITCAPKPQQQLQSVLCGARSTHQPGRIIAASNSTPALFLPSSLPAQNVPMFPAQMNSAQNAGLLPTPPGFNHPVANTAANDNGIRLHHSHSAAITLMQHFGLQQQYPQHVNGFLNQLPPFSHANASLNPFAVAPLFTTNQNFVSPSFIWHAHQPTFN